MEGGECALSAATRALNYDDVEMADADAEEAPAVEVSAAGGGGGGGGGAQAEKGGQEGKNKRKKKNRAKRRNKRRDGPPTTIGDISRFVNGTCKRLKEKKTFLVWNAVGCLGVTAVSDLVREVEAIQKCGGQTIADGSRFRTGGGILWNILKSREPKAYKEIMAKGNELEQTSERSKSKMMATTATRRWWRRRDGVDDDPDDLVPMDTQEQEELVRSLEQKQAHQSRRWRRVFAGFLLGYAAFMVYSSFHHAWSPWELRYHAYFMEDLPAPMVIIADWVAALACLFAVKGLLQNSGPSKKWIWYSFYVGILVAIFWTYYILRLPRIRWDVAWLPLSPLIAGALSLYVDHVLLESMQDISTLRNYMYNFKAL